MFGQHNTYGEYNNSYGNAPYYPPPTNEPFWGNKQQQNRMNYRQDPAIASDSLYGYNNAYSEQNLDAPINHIESGISGLNLNQSKHHEDFGTSSFAGSLGSRKPTSWASIASQPAKSQPKSLKSKMAASGLTGSTSKHLPPTVTMDAMSWESKNGSIGNASSGGKPIPPPPVIANSSAPPPPLAPSSASSIEDLPSPVIQTHELQQQQSPPQRLAHAAHQVSKENSWATNGNSSSSGSISASASSPRPSQAPILSGNSMPKVNNNNNNHRGYANEINENYNPNKYANQRNNNNYSKPIDNHQPYPSKSSTHSAVRDIPNNPPASTGDEDDGDDDDDEESTAVVEKLYVENDYNPKEFDLNPRNARFFIIKSYSEDDVHRSIKYSIWCSTEHGNKRLDTAFRQQEDKGPIYLLYSVNRSGHFCGIAQMMSPVDYNASSGVWAQDKWKGQFQVKWIYVKDVPNDELRHITLENNENKPVTNSRDTQEVPYEKGKKVINIIHNYEHRTSIFDDFLHYEKKQEEEGMGRKPDAPPSPPPPSNYPKMANPQFNSGMPRDNQLYRGNGTNFNKHRSYPDARDQREVRNDYRNDYRSDNRNDYRSERNDYRNERMDRPSDYGRDNRDRIVDHRNEYRDNHVRDSREYRDYREPPQFNNRDQYRGDFHPPPSREYIRERNNEYRPPDREQREFRDRLDPRDRNPNERQQQSWRN